MFTRSLAFTVTVATVVGCAGKVDDRQEVSGTVKLKGQPIKDGALIEFSSLDDQTTGVNAVIIDGAFSVPRRNGLKPGKYLVRVTAGDGTTPEEPTDPDAPPGPTAVPKRARGTNIVSKDLVPPEWNQNSKQQVTVTREGPNTFDFSIP